LPHIQIVIFCARPSSQSLKMRIICHAVTLRGYDADCMCVALWRMSVTDKIVYSYLSRSVSSWFGWPV